MDDAKKSMETLGSLGESRLIERLCRGLGAREDVRVGIGDDVAIVDGRGGMDFALTTDPVLEGSHFLPETPGESVGHKAVGRVLSDLASAGAEPAWLLIDVEGPADLPVSRVEAAYRGASALTEAFGAAIVGGDCAAGPVFGLHVFGVGLLPSGAGCLRSGASAGESLYVTGALGGSLAGRHLSFLPRVREGVWLRDQGWAQAMMDVSDGLATDVRHILTASGVGVDLDEAAIPVSDAARSAEEGRSPLAHAMEDGEDFELLFTVRPGVEADFERAWAAAWQLPCHRIGRVTENSGCLRMRGPDGGLSVFRGVGFEHFRGEQV